MPLGYPGAWRIRSKFNPGEFYEEHRQNSSEDGDHVRAQIVNGIDFTTSFPFYAGNAKMPAGSYKLTQADFDENVLLIESTDGSNYSASSTISPRAPSNLMRKVM
jgi:hypothetical protein